ncbi:hypothetical protein HHK36_029136 [Tetracentron sinense]|uniref:Ubiquitin-like domain-containing protein n=1 Tax=Tetracentron sinense TaxID=13715 RepID=A0A835D119_TETSI|nr:hypothetical protein HHK36_029136 [Tetracentron sinense]
MALFHLFVKLLDGKSVTLRFTSPTVSGESIKDYLYELTRIPTEHQRLLAEGRQINEETLITANEGRLFPTVHLLLRLIGGKGGFGSLLRGAATKAGQKKTNNFDACRDMSGRRLRHVNAEKKLEEWKAEAEERKLEKIAEDFIKKKAKAVKKSGSGESEKYIAKYREDSEKCMGELDASVRESLGLLQKSKRKISPQSASASKRLKIWMGKKKVDVSDSDDEDEDGSENEEDNEKSIVLDDGNNALQSKEAEGSSGSVSGGQSDGESSGGGSSQSNLDEEKGITEQEVFQLGEGSGGAAIHAEANSSVESEMSVQSTSISGLGAAVFSGTESVHAEEKVCLEPVSSSISSLGVDQGSEFGAMDVEAIGSFETISRVREVEVLSTKISDLEKPLNFDEFNSAAEMEVLGMERLKAELQASGLKCGGTLQERAARLFLLKTTPVEMLPKKLLAKK